MTHLALTGLKGHHPLGFLAACGLLRCCERWNDFGQTTPSWERSIGDGFVASLRCEATIDFEALAQVVNCSAKQQRESPAFTWSSKIDVREKYRDSAIALRNDSNQRTSKEGLDRLAALASDIVTDSKGRLRSSMLDLTSGNQRFLSSIRAVAGEAASKKGKPRFVTKEEVTEALIGPWQYRDSDHSLGWDPSTQRLHALRHKLPEQDKENRSVRLAIYLASEALPFFPCFAVSGKLRTTGFRREDEDDWFTWPIWTAPITVDTLRSLLSHPFDSSLASRGIDTFYRCQRTRTGGAEGNYQIFNHAEEWILDAK
ncbi:MAG: hypothetical protein KF777_24750 [Planctomycetaceae bacterium]|nr:hypothetical protein [Planctomycetaceae bacterium]